MSYVLNGRERSSTEINLNDVRQKYLHLRIHDETYHNMSPVSAKTYNM